MGKSKRRPRHRVRRASSADSRMVAFFHDANQGKWTRKPGDRLTWSQRADIVGGILVFVFLIGLVIFIMGCMFYVAVEIGRQPTPDR